MYRRLYRSRKDNMIAGVCGGLAEYFNVDPVIMRLIFVIATFLSGIGIVVYIVLWLIAPYEDTVRPVYTTTAAGETMGPDVSDIPPTGTAYEGTSEPGQGSSSYERKEEPAVEIPQPAKKNSDNTALGVVLIALGIIFLANNFIPFFSFWNFWPLLLIGIGAWILLKSKKNNI